MLSGARAPPELSAAAAHAEAAAGAATLLDLRTRTQHNALRPPCSECLPAGQPGPLGLLFRFSQSFVEEARARYPLSTPLLLLCDVGVVSRVAAGRLLAAGFKSVRVVSGGFEAWREEGWAQAAGGAADEAGGAPLPTEGAAAGLPRGESMFDYVAYDTDAGGETDPDAPYLPWPPTEEGHDSPLQPCAGGALERLEEDEDEADGHDDLLEALVDGEADGEVGGEVGGAGGAADGPRQESSDGSAGGAGVAALPGAGQSLRASIQADFAVDTAASSAAAFREAPVSPRVDGAPPRNALAGDDIDASLANMVHLGSAADFWSR